MKNQSQSSAASNLFFSKWMKYIDGNKRISELTIPGTHDSGTYPAWSTSYLTKCQTMDFLTQLKSGIRFLDIRLKRGYHADKDHVLWVYHGSANMDISFTGTVLRDCQLFLSSNKTETIIMSIKDESDPSENDDKDNFYDDLVISMNQRPGLFYTGTNIPRLTDVRGKIVLVRRFGLGKKSQIGIDLYDNWPPNDREGFNNYGTPFYVQDAFKGWGISNGREELKNKFNNWILPTLKLAIEKQNKESLFVNFTSGTGVLLSGTDPRSLAEGFDFGPIEFFHFEGVNRMLLNYIKSQENKRYGIVPMDFPELPDNGDVIKKLITLNTFTTGYRPDLNGNKFTNKFTGMVYWVMDGTLRYIPNPTVAKNIFGEQWSNGVRDELDLVTITTGYPLPLDIRIIRFGEKSDIYLSFTELKATRPIIRLISDTAIRNAYGLYGPVVTLQLNSENDYDRHKPLESPEAILNRPDLNGKRIHDGGTGQVYLIIDGVLRYIPNPETANNIFGSDWGVDGDIIPYYIKKSRPLPGNARLIRFGKTSAVYLSFKEPDEAKAVIRHIPNMLVLNEYGFHGKIQSISDDINDFFKELPLPAASSLDPE